MKMKFVEKVKKDGNLNELEQLREGMNFESFIQFCDVATLSIIHEEI